MNIRLSFTEKKKRLYDGLKFKNKHAPGLNSYDHYSQYIKNLAMEKMWN